MFFKKQFSLEVYYKVLKFILTFCFVSQKLSAQKICEDKKVILIENGRCNENPYILVFEDNFDGNSLDASKWNPATGVLRDLNHTIAKPWFTPNSIEVSNGTLITKRDTLINQCYNNGTLTICEDFLFTAAQIDTKEKFGHGKIEISCRIAKGKGIASSFWTYGDEMNEINIFEFDNENNAFNKFAADKSARVHSMNSHTDYD